MLFRSLIARCDPITGDLEDFDGNPIDPDDHRADTLLRYRSVIVMERERAEKEGREIIGPYEDAPEGRDLVELPDRRARERRPPGRGDE